jgi:hypothetical protein
MALRDRALEQAQVKQYFCSRPKLNAKIAAVGVAEAEPKRTSTPGAAGGYARLNVFSSDGVRVNPTSRSSYLFMAQLREFRGSPF